jgi:hypothetical protein
LAQAQFLTARTGPPPPRPPLRALESSIGRRAKARDSGSSGFECAIRNRER